jgi:hypothetical protein
MGCSRSTLCRLLRTADALPRLGRELVDRRERARLVLRGPQHDAPGTEPWQVRLGELLSYLPIDGERVAEARVRTSLSALYAERDAWLRDADADREGALEGVVDRLVTSCGVDGPGSGDATARVLALAHGVTVQICRQRLEPVAVVRLMTAEVERLAYARSGRVG